MNSDPADTYSATQVVNLSDPCFTQWQGMSAYDHKPETVYEAY